MITELLDELVKEINNQAPLDPKYLKSNGNANGFEDLFKDKIITEFNAKMKSDYPKEIIELKGNFGHQFPDLDLKINDKLYGIELKSKKDGTWQTQGGSVFETTSKISYEEIYVLFATFNASKHENKYKLRYAPYWEVADAIKVTHSPRVHLNLDTSESVFKSNQEYKSFRNLKKSDQNKKVQDILKETTSRSVWYIIEDNTIEPTAYSDLDASQRNKVYVESLLLFPWDLFKQPKGNYENVTKYFLSQYFIISSSMRDKYTAGGRISLKVANGTNSPDKKVSFPQIFKRYIEHREELIELLNSMNDELLAEAYKFWKLPKSNKERKPFDDFKTVLDNVGKKYYSEELSKIPYTSLSEFIFSQDKKGIHRS